MKKIRILKLFIILFSILIFIGLPYKVYAASASISSSVTTMELNESATITASISDTEAWNLSLNSNGGSLSGATASADSAGEEVSKSVMSATFTASNPGTYIITLSGEITGKDLNKQPVQQTLSINVIDNVKPSEEPNEPEQPEQPSEPSEPTTPSQQSGETETNKPETKKSSDASLSSLTAQANGKSLDVSKDSSKYSATVEADVTAVTFTVKANSSSASIDSNKSTSGIGFVKNSGTGANKTYTMSNLTEGNNVIKITVIAEDKTEKNYTFTVTKKVAENTEETQVVPNIVEEEPEKETEKNKDDENKDDGFGLKSLVITGVEISPEFNVNKYKYTATIEGSDSVEVIAIATDEDAKVEIVGNKNLVLGENLITVLVKKDENVKTYQIILKKTETANASASTSDDGTVFLGLTWKHLSIIIVAILLIIAVVIKLVFLSKKTVDDDYDYDDDEEDDNEFDDEDTSKRRSVNNKNKTKENIYYNDNNSRKGRRFK